MISPEAHRLLVMLNDMHASGSADVVSEADMHGTIERLNLFGMSDAAFEQYQAKVAAKLAATPAAQASA